MIPVSTYTMQDGGGQNCVLRMAVMELCLRIYFGAMLLATLLLIALDISALVPKSVSLLLWEVFTVWWLALGWYLFFGNPALALFDIGVAGCSGVRCHT